jgi:large subunit ribosomal protein L12
MKMNYIYSALLLHSAGKEVNEHNVRKVVSATGEEPDESKIKALCAALEGVDIADVISKAAMPVAVAAAAPAASSASEAKKEGPSEEELEKKAEEAAGGLASLFG